MSMTQTERIRKMESYLGEAEEAMAKLADAMDAYESVQDKYYELGSYYGSADWMADYEADEAGEFPADLKRGVLSEDAVYDLITDHGDLMKRMRSAVLRSAEEDNNK